MDHSRHQGYNNKYLNNTYTQKTPPGFLNVKNSSLELEK